MKFAPVPQPLTCLKNDQKYQNAIVILWVKMAKLDIFSDIIKLSRKKRISNKSAGPLDFT